MAVRTVTPVAEGEEGHPGRRYTRYQILFNIIIVEKKT